MIFYQTNQKMEKNHQRYWKYEIEVREGQLGCAYTEYIRSDLFDNFKDMYESYIGA